MNGRVEVARFGGGCRITRCIGWFKMYYLIALVAADVAKELNIR